MLRYFLIPVQVDNIIVEVNFSWVNITFITQCSRLDLHLQKSKLYTDSNLNNSNYFDCRNMINLDFRVCSHRHYFNSHSVYFLDNSIEYYYSNNFVDSIMMFVNNILRPRFREESYLSLLRYTGLFYSNLFGCIKDNTNSCHA